MLSWQEILYLTDCVNDLPIMQQYGDTAGATGNGNIFGYM